MNEIIKQNQQIFIDNFCKNIFGKIAVEKWKKSGNLSNEDIIAKINSMKIRNAKIIIAKKYSLCKFHKINRIQLENVPKDRKDYLAIACIIKDEAAYIKEWVDFHILAGVERFYIFDNGSTDNTNDILKPYIDKGIVWLQNYPGRLAQINAYNDAINLLKNKTKWLAIIDADEFLFPVKGTDIRKVLKEYEEYPAVSVNWVTFGSCGHEKKPEGTVIDNYYFSFENKNHELNCREKSIVQPEKTLCYCSPHYGIYKGGEFAVDENKQPVTGAAMYVMEGRACTFSNSTNILRINHYWTKSKEELKTKCNRGYPDGAPNAEYEKTLSRLNYPLVEDTVIKKFIEKKLSYED